MDEAIRPHQAIVKEKQRERAIPRQAICGHVDFRTKAEGWEKHLRVWVLVGAKQIRAAVGFWCLRCGW